MTNQQVDFLRLSVIEQKPYAEIEEILQVPRKSLTIWWEELKKDREYLSYLRSIWSKKFDSNNTDFWDFKRWYEATTKKCYYCGIAEEQMKTLIDADKLYTKRNRGRKLEIERILPNEPYDRLDNLVFSCYWCNNAKTDTFSAEEFRLIGKEIGKIWKKKLNSIKR